MRPPQVRSCSRKRADWRAPSAVERLDGHLVVARDRELNPWALLLIHHPRDGHPQRLGLPGLALLAVEGVDVGIGICGRIPAPGANAADRHIVALAEDDVGGMPLLLRQLFLDPLLVPGGGPGQDGIGPGLAVFGIARFNGPDVDILPNQEGLADMAGPGHGCWCFFCFCRQFSHGSGDSSMGSARPGHTTATTSATMAVAARRRSRQSRRGRTTPQCRQRRSMDSDFSVDIVDRFVSEAIAILRDSPDTRGTRCGRTCVDKHHHAFPPFCNTNVHPGGMRPGRSPVEPVRCASDRVKTRPVRLATLRTLHRRNRQRRYAGSNVRAHHIRW